MSASRHGPGPPRCPPLPIDATRRRRRRDATRARDAPRAATTTPPRRRRFLGPGRARRTVWDLFFFGSLREVAVWGGPARRRCLGEASGDAPRAVQRRRFFLVAKIFDVSPHGGSLFVRTDINAASRAWNIKIWGSNYFEWVFIKPAGLYCLH